MSVEQTSMINYGNYTYEYSDCDKTIWKTFDELNDMQKKAIEFLKTNNPCKTYKMTRHVKYSGNPDIFLLGISNITGYPLWQENGMVGLL